MKLLNLINNINLNDLSTSTIKDPKIQELRTIKLLGCFKTKFNNEIL